MTTPNLTPAELRVIQDKYYAGRPSRTFTNRQKWSRSRLGLSDHSLSVLNSLIRKGVIERIEKPRNCFEAIKYRFTSGFILGRAYYRIAFEIQEKGNGKQEST